VTTALRDGNGTPRGFAKLARDDTARKQAELALKASESRYRRLFEAAYDVILILEAESGRPKTGPTVHAL
jgi:PAS domain-containing protein